MKQKQTKKNSLKCFPPKTSDDSVPPPLPPHGITANGGNVEYRPPVPPHRNIGVTANINGQQTPTKLQPGQRVRT
jgi:hypothetical protein